MKRVAILGGGPAGAFAAERLASAGIDTVVFDEKLAWEKPCGGGLTYKAYHTISFPDRKHYAQEVVHGNRAGRAARQARPACVCASRC